MAPKRTAVLLTVLVLLVSLACSFSAITATSTPTVDVAATQALQASEAAAQAAAQEATAEAKVLAETAVVETSAAGEATQAYIDNQKTLAALATKKAGFKATKFAGTQVAFAEKTRQAESMATLIEDLYNDGMVSTTDGVYYKLDDFDQSWAQINWYQWWRTGLKLENFVIRADVEWDSASDIANWFDSGCGFVFAEKDADNHYSSFLALDGHVHNFRSKNGIDAELTGGYYGPVGTPSGDASLMMIVDQFYITFFVNGTRVVRIQDMSLGSGSLGLTLHSGTNLDYGTRCRMTNVEVWELK